MNVSRSRRDGGRLRHLLSRRQLVGIERAAPSLGLVPLFGVLGGALILHEKLSALHGVGGLLVVLGIALSAFRKRPSFDPSA